MSSTKAGPTRTESDSMGPIEVEQGRYWGAQTERSLRNFRISGVLTEVGTNPAVMPATCDNPVERNVRLGGSLGINGTPTLISGDGRMLPGAASKDQIEAWLQQTVLPRKAPWIVQAGAERIEPPRTTGGGRQG